MATTNQDAIVADEKHNQTGAVDIAQRRPSLEATQKSFWDRLWPVLACGAGLFSDGYLNNVIGSVDTILDTIYPDEYAGSAAQANVSSIAFVGIVVGMILFGFTSDHWSRKWTLLISTIIVIVFAALGAASYGANDSINGLFAALAAYRFFLGVGIGGEYPAGSVGCAEATGELKSGTRNRWFVLFTNVQIDFGYVVGAIVPCLVVLATGTKHLRAAWRICLGLGVIPPLSLLYLRLKLNEPEAYKRNSMNKAKTPWLLCVKYYGFRWCIVALIWFIYDFTSYSFGIYSSTIIDNLLGSNTSLATTFAWNILLNFFYMPGCIAGSFAADWFGPKKTLGYGVAAQGIVGFIMAGCYSKLYEPDHVAAFVVVYGIFLMLGEFGPGDNIGLIASKTSATAIRGKYYGFAAAFGKIGAFCGTRALEVIYDKYADTDIIKAGQIPVFISSALCFVSAGLVLLLPRLGQDSIDQEDIAFRQYLLDHGYDTSQMGTHSASTEYLNEQGRGSDSDNIEEKKF